MSDDKITPDYYGATISGIKLDPYRIGIAYQLTHPCHFHAVKKLLRAGRSSKSLVQDVQEVIDTLRRWQEMMKEDVSQESGE